MNINCLRRTRAVQKILNDIASYLRARVREPAEIIVTRATYAALRDAAGTAELDYNGIKVVCR